MHSQPKMQRYCISTSRECNWVPRRITLIGAARRDAVPAGLSRNGTATIFSSRLRDVDHIVDGAAVPERQRATYRLDQPVHRHNKRWPRFSRRDALVWLVKCALRNREGFCRARHILVC